MLKQQIDQDLKKALLSGDKIRTEVLRGLKSAILYREVADGARESGLSEDVLLTVLAKESKKRDESAGMYAQAGVQERADTELAEKAIIDGYLPAKLSDQELEELVDEAIKELGDGAQMGPVMSKVRARAGANADGAKIASFVKSKLG
jgi:uncharacterized protein YqeY